MRRHLTGVYLGSCALLIVFAVAPMRATAFVRRCAARFGAPAREAAPSLPVAVDFEALARPARDQVKKPGPRLSGYRLPAGTVLSVQLQTPISSASASVDDQVDATLSEPVTQNGLEMIPAGSLVHGSIVEVVAASKQDLRGRITMAFAVVQHALTKSRAAIKTRRVTIEAQLPQRAADSRRRSREQPVDLILAAGRPLELTLAEPLLVYLPAAGATAASARPARDR